MEILKRAEGFADSEIIPVTMPDKEMREKMIYHSWKKGHTTRLGECPYATKIQNIVPFGKTVINIWPRDENGQLIGD